MRLTKWSRKKANTSIKLGSISFKNRVWLLQAALVATTITGIFILLVLTGTFDVFRNDSYEMVKNEMDRSAAVVSQRYSAISNYTLELTVKVNNSIEKTLKEKGLDVSELKSNPDALEKILAKEVEKSIFAMQASHSSGVFVLLDATVNPNINNASDSKAGFYIKDMEPAIIPGSTNHLYLLRGSPGIAREYSMYLDTEWQLECYVGGINTTYETDFYNVPFKAAFEHKGKKLQELGYWSSPFKIDKNCETAMAFSVPLISRNGEVYGVCGLEVSERFLNSYMQHLSTSSHERLFYLFSTINSSGIDMRNALYFGDYSARVLSGDPGYLTTSTANQKEKGLKYYGLDNDAETKIVGLDTLINLYPSKSVFKEREWAFVALLPKADIAGTKILIFGISLVILLIAGTIIAYYTSRFCTNPLTLAFKQIKERTENIDKTNIPEIDDLIEFLKQEQTVNTQNIFQSNDGELLSAEEESPEQDSRAAEIKAEQYEEFSRRIQSLTKTEREIFELYLQGYTAKQICEVRYYSINTIKSHNRRIYAKLNVSSRVELLEYCYRLMDENSFASKI